ncbi:RagB/SusD family nutrient uptake outer membrane protein [Prolixibacteraceae bacterium]|nr:RagB/SusD family nutrient uptake outer membrane protein [Prolixibacteraceae bacterium]
MKKFIYIFLVAFTFACSEDFLEVTPTDAVGKADVISSSENMRTALNGVHRLMYQQSPIDAGNSRAGEGYIMPLLEFGGNDMLHSSSGNGWFNGRIKWLTHINPDYTDARFPWIHYYHLIANVNNIINAGETMTQTDDLKNVLGQAYAYRAFAYFRLVQLYANSYTWGTPSSDPGVPIVLETKAPYAGTKRETVEAVYDLVTSDIQKAITLLTASPNSGDLSNISLGAAQGIAARVYLTMGNWTEAAGHAKLAQTGYSLMSESQYLSGFNRSSLPEMMWSGHIVSDQTAYFYAWFYYIGTSFNGTQNRTNPKMINQELYAQISNTDYRKKLWLSEAPDSYLGALADPRYAPEIPESATPEEKKALEDAAKTAFEADRKVIQSAYGITSRFYTTPYMSVKFLNQSPGTIDPDDVMYMRVSEMYLIEAEALCREGQYDAAATALYNLVSIRDDAYVKSAETGDNLLQEILVQRRIELWGEGHRWLDMLRNDVLLDLSGSGASQTLYSNGYRQAKPSANSQWLFKIPSEEINANPNINDTDQN